MKGDAFLEVQEAIQLMLGFGTFVVTLLTFVLALIKHNNNQKNNRTDFGRVTVIF